MTTTPSHPWSLAAAAVMILGALGVLVAQAVQYTSVPSNDDWRRAAQSVREQATGNDAFRVEPEWDSRPRVHLQEMAYVPAQDATWFDTAPYERVWILAESGRESIARARMPGGWRFGDSAQRFESVVVMQALPPEPDPTLWDVFGALSGASVRREYAARAETCERFEGGDWPTWHCRKRDPLMVVGETLQTVTNDTHRCLWAMPIDQGGRLVISFEGVARGRTIQGHHGQPIDAVRSKRGGPVRFEVMVEGEVVYHKTFGLHEEGFEPWSAALPAGEGALGSVAFSVQASNHLDRFFCFTARVVE